MEIRLSDLDRKGIYKLMTSVIVPRPIAWISTISKDGIPNLAPFSYYAGISSEPPLIVVSIGRKKDGERKDTWQNIEDTGEFVINLVDYPLAEKMVITSHPFDREVNEFKEAGLTEEKSSIVKAPSVLEAPVKIECENYQIIQIGHMGLVIGKVLLVRFDDKLWNPEGYIDTTKLDLVGRLGGNLYCRINKENIFEIKKPK